MLKPDSMSLLNTDNDSFGKIYFYCLSTVACMKSHNYGCIANLHQCAKFFFFAKIVRYALYSLFKSLKINPLNHQTIFP